MKPPSPPLRVGVLGCAAIANRSFLPALAAVPGLELRAVASRDPEKAARTATRFGCLAITGYGALLERPDIDAVYVPLPSGLHNEWVGRALDSGRHVLAEKSLATSHEQVAGLVERARRGQLVLMEDFMYRHHSQHARVFEWLRDGTLGEFRLLRADFGFPPLAAGDFRYDGALGGGVVLDAAAYTVDAACWFLGDRLDVEQATLFVDPANGVPLYGSAVLADPASGQVAQLGFGFDNQYRCQYEIWGSRGSVVAERAFTPRAHERPRLRLRLANEQRLLDAEADDHFVGIARAFLAAVRGEDREALYGRLLAQARLLDQIHARARRHPA